MGNAFVWRRRRVISMNGFFSREYQPGESRLANGIAGMPLSIAEQSATDIPQLVGTLIGPGLRCKFRM